MCGTSGSGGKKRGGGRYGGKIADPQKYLQLKRENEKKLQCERFISRDGEAN